jgi:glycerophosphoryl diester phosphodiesterase
MFPEVWMALAHEQMLWLEAHRHPVLDAIFLVITWLGSEAFLMLFMAVGYWVGDRRVFARAALMLLVAALVNTGLKGVFLEPRPQVSHVHPTGGWSFPSGHAQVAAAMWGGLAWDFRRRRRLSAALVILALLVAASRPYLGVHYPHDVVVGALLGGVQVGWLVLIDRLGLGLPLGGRARWGGLAAGLALFMLVLWSFHASVAELGVRFVGALTGLVVGLSWARGQGWTEVPRAPWERARLLGLGLAGLVLVWLGAKQGLAALGLEENVSLAFLRYVVIGLWVAVLAPLLDVWLGDRERGGRG